MPGVPLDAFGLLEDSFKGIVAHNLSLRAHRRLPRRTEPVATTTIEHLSSDDEDEAELETSNVKQQQQHHIAGLRSTTPPLAETPEEVTTPPTNPQLIRQRSGLPPTPPSGSSNANNAEVVMAERKSAEPLFADGVRNALESKRSGLSTPTPTARHHHSPPTPEASPPSTSVSRDPLLPDGDLPNSNVQRPVLHQTLSEYAESFRTAEEGLATPVPDHSESEPEPRADWEHFVSFINSNTTSAEPSPPVTRAGEELGGNTRMSWNATPPELRRRSTGAATSASTATARNIAPSSEDLETSPQKENQSSNSPTETRRLSDGLAIFHATNERNKRPETPPHRRDIAKEARMAGRVSSIKKQGGWKVADLPEANTHRDVAKEALDAKRHSSMRADGTLQTWAQPELDSSEVEKSGKTWTRLSTSHASDDDQQQDALPARGQLERQDTEVTQFEEDEVESPLEGGRSWPTNLDNLQTRPGAESDNAPVARRDLEQTSSLGQVDNGLRTQLFDEPDELVADITTEAHAHQDLEPASIKLPPSPSDDGELKHDTNEDQSTVTPSALNSEEVDLSTSQSENVPQKEEENPPDGLSISRDAAIEAPLLPNEEDDTLLRSEKSSSNAPDRDNGLLLDDHRTNDDNRGVESSTTTEQAAPQTLVAPAQQDLETHTSAPEDLHPDRMIDATVNNDALYKHIRSENMRRMSALMDGNAVQASIVETQPQRSHTLRRSRKVQSLREDSDSSSSKEQRGMVRGHSLKHKKAMSPRRQISTTVPLPAANVARKLQESPSIPAKVKQDRRALHESNSPVSTTKSVLISPSTHGSHHSRPQVPAADNSRSLMNGHKLKRSLRDDGLDRNFTIKRNSMSSEEPSSPTLRQVRHFSKEERLENNHSVRRTSAASDHAQHGTVDSAALLAPPTTGQLASPKRLEVGHARLRSNSTPFSVASDRSEMEVCEATGVAIFPHNNNSLLVVQQGSRPLDKQEAIEAFEGTDLVLLQSYSNGSIPRGTVEKLDTVPNTASKQPVFTARLRTATPPLGTGTEENAVESPLRNPRRAPQPPVIKFIPPTPNHEDEEDKQLTMVESLDLDHPPKAKRPGAPVRRESLRDRAKRFSDNYVMQPLFGSRQTSTRSVGPKKVVTMVEERETNLHPFWKPRYFFSEFESDSDDYFDDEDYEVLPRGGDTSDHPTETRKASLLPRSLSLRKAQRSSSQGSLRRTNSQTGGVTVQRSNTIGSVWKTRHGKIVTLPGGSQLQYVGLTPFRHRMNSIRLAKEEKEAEKRRARLRDQIGYRVYHG